MPSSNIIRVAATNAEMEALGARLAQLSAGGLCIHLQGPLAAGKTTFARGYILALGHPGAVKSPTYTLVESYLLASREVHHFDLYRLVDASELEHIGIDDYFDSGADCLIEWPERGGGILPVPDLMLRFTILGTERGIEFEAVSEAGIQVISSLF